MAFSHLWTLLVALLLGVIEVKSDPPVPVLDLPENVYEGDDTTVTCSLPCANCRDVNLTIAANVTFKSCSTVNGHKPNVSCTLKVTRETRDTEFICQAQFRTQSPPKKMTIKIPATEPGGRSGRTQPVSAAILALLLASIFLFFLH